jgi:5-methylcytosine-specific restriction endonuclease McrA
MARYAFTWSERWAVFNTHGTRQGTKCWLCGEPVNLVEMEVDHILPESLLRDRSALDAALTDFGLPSAFQLNSFENWLPAHRRCNAEKRERIFRPTPIIQMWIDHAREKADAARQARDAFVSDRKIERAIGVLSAGDKAAPKDMLDPLIQHYATANSSVITVAQTVDETKLDWMQGIPTQYVPPKEVRLGPDLIVIFDDEPKPSPTGPFTYRVEAKDLTLGSPTFTKPSLTSRSE